MSSSYRESLDKWLSELEVKAGTVIDIGGSQLPVKGRTKSWEVKKYLIADLDTPHVGSPAPDIEIDLNGYADTDRKADLIFCLEVFEYVYDPVNAMLIICNLLKPGGTAWVTFPFVYPLHQPVEDDSLRYTIQGVMKLASVVGLTVSHYQVRRPETSIMQFYSAERMRAAKGFDHETMGWIVRLKK